jgi:hypothetical protein
MIRTALEGRVLSEGRSVRRWRLKLGGVGEPARAETGVKLLGVRKGERPLLRSWRRISPSPALRPRPWSFDSFPMPSPPSLARLLSPLPLHTLICSSLTPVAQSGDVAVLGFVIRWQHLKPSARPSLGERTDFPCEHKGLPLSR